MERINPLLVALNAGDTVYVIRDNTLLPLSIFKVLPDGVRTVIGELLFEDYKKSWWYYKAQAEAVLNG